MAQPSDIANIIAGMKALFPNYNPDPARTTSMFMQVLGDMDTKALTAAAMSLASDGRAFAPSAGEIRAEALRLNAIAAGIPDAYRAYDEVVKMPADMIGRRFVDTPGFVGQETWEMRFSHPTVEQVARLMGWPKTFPTDMAGVDRAQFVKAYDAEVQRVMSESGRLKIVDDYVKSRAALGNSSLSLTENLTKKLEMKK